MPHPTITCYRCGNRMTEGFVAGRTGAFDQIVSSMVWHPDKLEYSWWSGYRLSKDGKKRFPPAAAKAAV